MAQPPAIEQVIAAVVERLEKLVPSKAVSERFRRSSEGVSLVTMPARASKRLFNVDAISGRDLSQEGEGVINQGGADRRATFRVEIAYSRETRERDLEVLVPSDAEIILRGLARSADWTGTPVRRATARWQIDRQRAQDRLLLYVDLDVLYRDQE